jgi:hypothetical protein
VCLEERVNVLQVGKKPEQFNCALLFGEGLKKMPAAAR